MIVTQRQLQHLLREQGKVIIPYRARLSPMAQDWVRHHKIIIGYDDQTAGVNPYKIQLQKPYLWWADGPDGVAKAALSMSARDVSLQPMTILEDNSRAMSAIRTINRSVADHTAAGAVLIVKNAGPALIIANKAKHLRATVAGTITCIEQAMALCAANVLVIQRDLFSLNQIKNMLLHFCRGERVLDTVMKSEIDSIV
jgi:hypothetical protein